MRLVCFVFTVFNFLLIHPDIYAGPVLYVDSSVTGGNADGSSWQDAFSTLNQAITAASSDATVAEIWMAEGTYYPTSGTDRDLAFDALDGVDIYGGFAGTESSINERNLEESITIISGDIGQVNQANDNSKNLFHLRNISTIIFDGIYFENALNDAPAPFGTGGAFCILNSGESLVSTIQFKNCIFQNNRSFQGAAIYLLAADNCETTVSFESCTFKSNDAAGTGGVLHQAKMSGADLQTAFYHCLFEKNNSNTGGAIYLDGDNGAQTEALEYNLALYNCILDQNTSNSGGAIYAIDDGSSTTIRSQNSTFYENTGNTIFLSDNATAEIKNSILWGSGVQLGFPFISTGDSYDVDNSIVAGGFAGSNNMDVDPEFGDAATGNFRISACSPALDAGINFANPAVDFSGANRMYNSTLDIGAFEFNGKFINLPLRSENNANALATSEITDDEGWTHYYNCNTKVFQGSILKNGQNLGVMNTGAFSIFSAAQTSENGEGQDLSAADYLQNENEEWFVMNNSWNVNSTATLTGNVGIRFYFTQDDITELENSFGGSFELTDLQFIKISGSGLDAYSTDVIANGGQVVIYTHAETASLTHWTLGQQDQLYYAEFLVNGFSSGTGGLIKGSVLPVELGSFTTQVIANKRIALNWKTVTEQNNDYFIVERSADAKTFESIGIVQGEGTTDQPQYYSLVDESPLRGKNYYRLRQVDFDNKQSLSETVIGLISNESEKILLFPNPATDELFVQVPETVDGAVQFTIFDTNGKAVRSTSVQATSQSVHALQLNQLLPGIYTLKVRSRYHREMQRFLIRD